MRLCMFLFSSRRLPFRVCMDSHTLKACSCTSRHSSKDTNQGACIRPLPDAADLPSAPSTRQRRKGTRQILCRDHSAKGSRGSRGRQRILCRELFLGLSANCLPRAKSGPRQRKVAVTARHRGPILCRVSPSGSRQRTESTATLVAFFAESPVKSTRQRGHPELRRSASLPRATGGSTRQILFFLITSLFSLCLIRSKSNERTGGDKHRIMQ
jgi:hypothetical protein